MPKVIEIQLPHVNVGDTVRVNPLSSDFAEVFAYHSIPEKCVLTSFMTQEANDCLKLSHTGTYVVKELFMHPYQARKENEYGGAPGYLVLLEDITNSAIRYLVEEWIVEKIEREDK